MRYSENLDSPMALGKSFPLTRSEEQQNVKRVFLNPMQLQVEQFGARVLYLRAARGTGKTTICGRRMVGCVQTVPRGLGLFIGSSVRQLYIRTVPNLAKSIELLTGLKEGLHFYRGHAPKSAKFIEPFVKPRIWENAIHFYNGSIALLTSMGVTGSANGLNSCWLMSDETKFLNMRKLNSEVLPTLRGDSYTGVGWKSMGDWNHPGNPYYLSQTYVSDAGITMREKEWEKLGKENQTPEINEQIAEMLAELSIVPELANVPRFQNKIQHLRCQSRVFFNFSSVENISMLGEEYLQTMKRQLPDLLYRINILGQDLTAVKDGFYYQFDEDLHCYTTEDADDTQLLQSKFMAKFKKEIWDAKAGLTRKIDYDAVDLDATAAIDDCSLDSDLQWDLPLHIAFDPGANLNVCVVGQVNTVNGRETLSVLKTFYTKNERKLESLCRDVVKYYLPKIKGGCKDIILYTDTNDRQGQSYATEINETTRYDKVMAYELAGGKRKTGFKVFEKHLGQPMSHEGRYRFINSLFSGEGKIGIRIHSERNEFLVTALQAAEVRVQQNGIHKFKGHEKYAEDSPTAGDPKSRTDVTDAFDKLCCGVRFKGTGMHSGGLSGLVFTAPTYR